MKGCSKGFTVIEVTMTLIIVSVIAWILGEILSSPLRMVVYNRESAEIAYLADRSIEKIESSLRSAQIDTIRVESNNELQFKNEDNHDEVYQCHDQQLRLIQNNQSYLMAPDNNCLFEVQQEKDYLQVKIWLTFMHQQKTPVSFYREVNLRGKL
ncbi:MAG: prepilin-type N-terminal cleavage/methylation domain-containing protein [Gammaproteobacteria bacterium]